MIDLEPCLQELGLLQEINGSLKALAGDIQDNNQYAYGVWTAKRKGKSVLYETLITYAGATMSITLDFPKAVQINRIEQMWNDATARDFSLRAYTDPTAAYYVELDTQTVNTALNRILQLGIEYKYPAGSRFQAYYSTFTAGKICKLVVQVDEL